jgi:hypothetical protein
MDDYFLLNAVKPDIQKSRYPYSYSIPDKIKFTENVIEIIKKKKVMKKKKKISGGGSRCLVIV